MTTVVVTDNAFDSFDVESEILRPLGCEIVISKKVPPPEELARLVADAEHVLTQFAPLNAAVIGAMRRAKVIVRYGVGVDNVDLEAARRRGIPVCNVPDYCTDEVADHTLALLLATTRRVLANNNRIRSGGWGLVGPFAGMKTLRDLTIGVVGFGRIGREVVRRLHGFKCRMLVHDPVIPDDAIREAGCKPAALDALLGASDVVTLHCPSTAQTRRMLRRDTIARMKPGAILINVARGDLVESAALVEALERGHLSAAGLDVFDPEPLPSDSPLRTMDNVVVSSHVAATSERAVRALRQGAAGTIAASIRGEPLPNVVNGVTARKG
ncbi:MAG: C-terminal binding protein [Planctomycetes bacterium]|nr:C-terminal binding protein [Planctomycetota bacterium]